MDGEYLLRTSTNNIGYLWNTDIQINRRTDGLTLDGTRMFVGWWVIMMTFNRNTVLTFLWCLWFCGCHRDYFALESLRSIWYWQMNSFRDIHPIPPNSIHDMMLIIIIIHTTYVWIRREAPKKTNDGFCLIVTNEWMAYSTHSIYYFELFSIIVSTPR